VPSRYSNHTFWSVIWPPNNAIDTVANANGQNSCQQKCLSRMKRQLTTSETRTFKTSAVGLTLSGWAHSPIVLVLAFACVGFANASMGLVGATHRSLAIPQNFRVRILAASNMTTLIAGILGPMIAGVALTHWAVGKVYTCFGLATCLLAFGFVLIPRSREFFALNHGGCQGTCRCAKKESDGTSLYMLYP
jgi:MFS family permease